MEDDDRNLTWSSPLEDIIAGEAEICRGLAWIHQRAEMKLSARNNFIAIPVIILSTLSGTASIGSDKLFNGSDMASVGIGLVSILVGILQTLSTYFKFAQKSEAHHIAFLHYSKLFTWVRVELGLPRKERMTAQDLLKELRDNMTRLAETTPLPPNDILDEFNNKFKDYDATISRPLEVNGLHKIKIYRKEEVLKTPSIDMVISVPTD